MSVTSLSYTSVTRINSVFPMISSVANITSGVVAQFADDAEAEIDAKSSKRYTLPLGVACPILSAIATREAIYQIATQRALVQFPPAQQGKHPMKAQHDEDVALLEEISNGGLAIVTSSGAVVPESTTEILIYSTTQGYVPTFSEGATNDQVQDEDKLADDLAARGLS